MPLHLNLRSYLNPYFFEFLNELFQSKSTISSLALKIDFDINDEILKNICEALKIESNIREIDLNGNWVLFIEKPNKFRLMLDSLKEQKSIKEIILTDCNVLDSRQNTLVLSNFLTTMNHIQKLNLNSSNDFRTSKKQALKNNNRQMLFEALTKLKYLIELDLSNIYIGSAILYLSTFLKTNQSLTKLNLADTGIGESEKEMAGFCKALEINNSLQVLNLERNDLVSVVEVFTQSIKVNKSLKN